MILGHHYDGSMQKRKIFDDQFANIWLVNLIICPKNSANLLSTKMQTVILSTIIKGTSFGITSKPAYLKLQKPLLLPPTGLTSLEQSLNLRNVSSSIIYLLPSVTTIESSLRSFQNKILNNTLCLYNCLFKFNIISSRLCSLGKLENESVRHLSSICPVTCS